MLAKPDLRKRIFREKGEPSSLRIQSSWDSFVLNQQHRWKDGLADLQHFRREFLCTPQNEVLA